jgi:hypothetical protein
MLKFREDPGAVLDPEAYVVARATHDSYWIPGHIGKFMTNFFHVAVHHLESP